MYICYTKVVSFFISRMNCNRATWITQIGMQYTGGILQFPLYRDDGYDDADCLHTIIETRIWTCALALTRFRLTVWLRALSLIWRRAAANLQRYLELCSVSRWNEISLAAGKLLVEKQTAYSNTPLLLPFAIRRFNSEQITPHSRCIIPSEN